MIPLSSLLRRIINLKYRKLNSYDLKADLLYNSADSFNN